MNAKAQLQPKHEKRANTPEENTEADLKTRNIRGAAGRRSVRKKNGPTGATRNPNRGLLLRGRDDERDAGAGCGATLRGERWV